MKWWEAFTGLLRTLLTLANDVKEYRAEVKELRQRILEVTLVLQQLSNEIKLSDQRQVSELEKLRLELENTLLRFERRLPPGSNP
jgi:ABC-type phosphate transport system auxiliary subunit